MDELARHLQHEEQKLIAARDEALELARIKPTVANRKAYRKAARTLEDFLAAQSEPEGVGLSFATVAQVVEYLTSKGWKISQSACYDHWKKDGKLAARPDGTFAHADVMRYANEHLQKKDGSAPAEQNLQHEKQRAEVRRILSDAEMRELKLRERMGELISRDQVEIELSERAQNLKNYFDNVARSSAGRIIKLVGGDPQKAPELITFLLGLNRRAFDNYARPIEGVEDDDEN